MRIKFLVLALLLLVLLAGCKGGKAAPASTPTPEQGFTPTALAWLKAHAIPFETADPTLPLNDLDPLKSIVGDARIVALGEATVGTHEFIQMKQRMLEYLVEKMGFNTFVLPMGYPEGERLDAYIHTGEGDLATFMKYAYEGNTQEFMNTIEWMRAYNFYPTHARKISFYGFNFQSDQLAREDVSQFIQKVDPLAAAQIQDDYSCYPQASDACLKKLQDVIDRLNGHQTDYSAKSSPETFEKALHDARIVLQNVTFFSNHNNNDLGYQYITENIQWILDHAGPDSKVIIWDHNLDIRMDSSESNPTIGAYLHQKYGDDLVVFGFLFYRGSFHAIGIGSQSVTEVFHAAEPPGDSYEFFFQAAGLPRFFLDMRPARADSPDQAWLFSPHPSYQVGGMYNPNDPLYLTAPLAKMYDVAVYFKDTTPSVLLNP